MSTVRFTQLVKECGKPVLKILWGAPEKDAEFQRAVKAGRVLTIHQNNVGSKADFGEVGFSPKGPAQYLIFPKSLKSHDGKRVVGINYEVFEAAPVAAPKKARTLPGKTKAPSETPKKEAETKVVEPIAPQQEEPPEREQKAEVGKAAPEEKAPKKKPSEPPKQKTSKKTKAKARSERPMADVVPFERITRPTELVKELRLALKDLEAGKSVAVYKRLERLAESLETS